MTIPIYIISHNRKSYLSQLIDRLETVEDIDIIIIDNGSTYEPLIEYYKTIPHEIIYLENLGHFSPWIANVVPDKSFYAVTDCDVMPCSYAPNDFPKFMTDVLKSNSELLKVGFSLRIDNLPDHYQFKKNVIDWENQYYNDLLEVRDGVPLYRAPIDTTFAFYNIGKRHDGYNDAHLYSSIRTGHPYSAVHLPWYSDTSAPSEEEIFYLQNGNRDIISWSHESVAGYLQT